MCSCCVRNDYADDGEDNDDYAELNDRTNGCHFLARESHDPEKLPRNYHNLKEKCQCMSNKLKEAGKTHSIDRSICREWYSFAD